MKELFIASIKRIKDEKESSNHSQEKLHEVTLSDTSMELLPVQVMQAMLWLGELFPEDQIEPVKVASLLEKDPPEVVGAVLRCFSEEYARLVQSNFSEAVRTKLQAVNCTISDAVLLRFMKCMIINKLLIANQENNHYLPLLQGEYFSFRKEGNYL